MNEHQGQQQDARAQVTPDHAVNVGLILELRARPKPPDWASVARLLKLSRKVLNSYRWLIAAEQYALGNGWADIARHPAVGFQKDTIRKGHQTATLAAGLSWDEYVGAYRDALAARTAELQTERGEMAAARLHALALRGQSFMEDLQDRLEDFRDNPPDTIRVAPKFTISGRDKPPAQASLFDEKDGKPDFSKLEGQPVEAVKPPEPRLSIEACRYLLGMQNEITGGLQKIAVVLGINLPEPDDDTPETAAEIDASEEQLRELLKRSQALDAELKQYAGGAA